MSRTSRSVPAVALLAVLAGLTLTGCSDAKSGAAAVVNGDRIEISTLNNRVKEAVDARESVGARPEPGVQETHDQLSQLVEQQVTDEAARRAKITVTATEIDDAKRQWEQGNGISLATAKAQDGVPADRVDAWVRTQLQQIKLLQAAGVPLNSQAVPAALARILNDTAKSMTITINPRYGSAWTFGDIAPTVYPWLKPDQLTTA